MAQALPFVGVDQIRDVDQALIHGYRTDRFQIFVSELTPLSHAVDLCERMRAGTPGAGYRVFNPELLVLKAYGESQMQAALSRVTDSINAAVVCFVTNELYIAILEENIALGAEAVHVGPSINRRSLPVEQVVYPTTVQIPEAVPAPPRRTLSRTQKLQFRGHDASSQIQFWELNLAVLIEKQAALGEMINSLVASRDRLRQNALHERTRLGSGYTDYTFYY